MRLRRLLTGAVGVAGLAVAGNAALERRAGKLEPPLHGSDRTYRWRGMDVAYTEMGDPADPTVLLLHDVGLAGTSRTFRSTVVAMAGDYHVVAPDLPGYGCSDRPRIRYDADIYVDFVREFTADVTPGATCVAAGLSGAYAALAQREAGLFDRLVLVCPTGTTRPIRKPRWERVLRLPIVGRTASNVIVSIPALRLRAARDGNPPPADNSLVDYRWRSAHQPGARFAAAAYLSGRLDPDANVRSMLEDIAGPVTIIWGRATETIPLSYGRDLAEATDGRLLVFDAAGSDPHVTHPEAFADTLRRELQEATGSSRQTL